MLQYRTIYSKATNLGARLPHQKSLRKLDALRPGTTIPKLPYSTQGYGDPEGDPHGENPASQGVNRRSRELEHPGPPPPNTKTRETDSSKTSKKAPSESTNKSKEDNFPPRATEEEYGNDKKAQGGRG